MKNILVINASANKHVSYSRRLSVALVDALKELGPTDICFRDLADVQVPHINQRWIEADRMPSEKRSEEDKEILKTSDSLIQELHWADIIILATPMYNWSIPSTLKAYMDHVIRFDETFILGSGNSDKRYIGLLKDKTLYFLFSRGSQGYGKGERNEHMDFQSGYLQLLFRIMGIEKIKEIAINGTARGGQELEEQFMALKEQISTQLNKEVDG